MDVDKVRHAITCLNNANNSKKLTPVVKVSFNAYGSSLGVHILGHIYRINMTDPHLTHLIGDWFTGWNGKKKNPSVFALHLFNN